MADNKKTENQANILTDEELEQVAGGMVNHVGVVTNPSADKLDVVAPTKSTEQKPNSFQHNCG